jgi:hypothetical protein
VPVRKGEVLVRIDAVAICALILRSSTWSAAIQGGLPFNKNFTPVTNTWAPLALGPGVDEYKSASAWRSVTPLRTVQTMRGHVCVTPQLRAHYGDVDGATR